MKRAKQERDDFAHFWTVYPKRRGKHDAMKAWTKLNPSPDLVQQMLVALAWQVQQRDWQKEDGQFVPMPATWLRGQRWDDEPPAARTVLTEEALGAHAAAFLERYRALYTELRRGARLKILTGNLDFGRACELLQTWDGAYLERLARIFLTTDEDWISRTDRGFAVFASKASWCDDRLKAAEHGAGSA